MSFLCQLDRKKFPFFWTILDNDCLSSYTIHSLTLADHEKELKTKNLNQTMKTRASKPLTI